MQKSQLKRKQMQPSRCSTKIVLSNVATTYSRLKTAGNGRERVHSPAKQYAKLQIN